MQGMDILGTYIELKMCMFIICELYLNKVNSKCILEEVSWSEGNVQMKERIEKYMYLTLEICVFMHMCRYFKV